MAVLQDERVPVALLPLPPKTWVTRVAYLHPAYVEIAFALGDADNSTLDVSHDRLLRIKCDCVLRFVTNFAY